MIIKLKEYNQLYRPDLPPIPRHTLSRDARIGALPDAFKKTPNGDWWINTLEYEKYLNGETTPESFSNEVACIDDNVLRKVC